MSDNPTPYGDVDETPATEPLPVVPSNAVGRGWTDPNRAAVGVPVQPARSHHANNMIAAAVAGGLLIAFLSFGMGWTAKSVTSHFGFARAGFAAGPQFEMQRRGGDGPGWKGQPGMMAPGAKQRFEYRMEQGCQRAPEGGTWQRQVVPENGDGSQDGTSGQQVPPHPWLSPYDNQ
jgi:hypothetical protein